MYLAWMRLSATRFDIGVPIFFQQADVPEKGTLMVESVGIGDVVPLTRD